MTEERDAAVTGVARGSLGTGTALDDTQVWDLGELQTGTANDEPAVERSTATAAAAARSVGDSVGSSGDAAVPVAQRVPRARVERRPGGASSRAPVLAVLGLLAVVGGAALAAAVRPDGNVPAVDAASPPPATAAPADDAAGGADGKKDDAKGGKKKDDNNGKDNGGGGRGNGNGGGGRD